MKVILDGRNMTSKESLHAYVKEKFQFPEYYGNNLDALYDLLTERTGTIEIELLYAEEIKERLCGYGEAFIETLQDAVAENKSITLIFTESR